MKWTEIIKWKRDFDLRVVSPKNLMTISRRYKLKDGQGVLFTNRTYSRARLVMHIDGLPVMLLFPGDAKYTVMGEMFRLALQWIRNRAKLADFQLNNARLATIRKRAA